ncbi:MAG: SpoIIE family protein phosphatase [Bacteroidales bacterium]|nr:SpoIIE family protein phosphatase [Bacteroidales bacterium]
MNDDPNIFFENSLDEIFDKFKKTDIPQNKPHNPYKFLDSYTLDDKDIFFGREKEIEELYRKYNSSNLLLVYGQSGTGKTSVINCGLLAKIPSQDIYPIFIRCGKKPIENLILELKKHSHSQSDDINLMITEIYSRKFKPVTLFFDQFEELFIFSGVNERKIIQNQLIKITNSNKRANIVIILREEYFACLSEFENDIPQIFNNRVRIEKMNRLQVKSVIENPLKICNIGIEEGINESIIEILCKQSHEIELTYLQILLDKLVQNALLEDPNNPQIKKEYLSKINDVGNILNDFLDEQINILPNSHDAEVILKAMVSSEGTKEPLKIDEISDRIKETGVEFTNELIHDLLQHFINLRIIKDKDEKDQYELKHDSLAKGVFQRMSLFEKEFIEAKRLINNRYNDFLKRQSLLDEKSLTFISSYEKRMVFSEEIKDFIKRSKRQLQLKKEEEQKFKDTLTSITYTNQIINAFLPSRKQFEENLKEYFIYIRPKELVGGDFYFLKKIENKVYLAVADSTGAGIPAALQSMLGLSLLNETITSNKLQAHEILNILRKKIITLLKQEETNSGDGYDMGLCIIDIGEKKMQFSNAFLPLYMFRDGKFTEFESKRIAIGYNPFFEGDIYQSCDIKLEKGDIFYLCTDGYANQMNGMTFQKYNTKRVRQLLQNIYTSPLETQPELLENEFLQWKGKYKQMDDILIVGFKVY